LTSGKLVTVDFEVAGIDIDQHEVMHLIGSSVGLNLACKDFFSLLADVVNGKPG
jgi:hypothetical protein